MALTVPGWYPDPIDASGLRFWNGAQWTSDTLPITAHTGARDRALDKIGQHPYLTIAVILVSASLFLIAGQLIRYAYSTAVDGPNGGLALLTPWVLLFICACLIGVCEGPLRLALIAGSGTLGMAYAAPFVIDRLPGLQNLEVVWLPDDYDGGVQWIRNIANGTSLYMNLATWLMAIGMLLLFAYSIATIVILRDLLLGYAARSSFGVDLVVLLTSFTFVGLIPFQVLNQVSGTSVTLAQVLDNDVAQVVRTLSWILPVVIWLALMTRQGGSLAVGATTGLVCALVIVPLVIEVLGLLLGAQGAVRAASIDGVRESGIEAYTALDWQGFKPWLAGLALVMLVVALWWSLGLQSLAVRGPVSVRSGASVNWLSVAAFVLAFLPIASIVGLVMGHIAYDQVIDSQPNQRGLGLARWAIVLSYLNIATLGLTAGLVLLGATGQVDVPSQVMDIPSDLLAA